MSILLFTCPEQHFQGKWSFWKIKVVIFLGSRSKIKSELCLKDIGRDVKTAFYLSSQTNWGKSFFEIVTFSESLSDFAHRFQKSGEITSAELSKLPSTSPKEHFEENNFSGRNLILGMFLHLAQKLFRLPVKKFWQCCRNCFLRALSNNVRKKIMTVFMSRARNDPRFVKNTSVGLSKQLSSFPKEHFEENFFWGET